MFFFKIKQFDLIVFLLVFLGFLTSGFLGFLLTNELKSILSLSFFIALLSCFVFYNYFYFLNFYSIYRVFVVFVFVLLFLGWLDCFFKVDFFNYGLREKPVFPFSEQSHYALTTGLLIVAISSVSSYKMAFFLILNILLLSFIYPNLTLLVFSFLSIVAVFSRAKGSFLFVIYFFISFLFIYFYLNFISSNDYFLSRLEFYDTTNLTTLVWLQGWQLAYLNFIESYGLGLGFNVLGLSTTITPVVSDVIYNLTGEFFNVQDGGFLAAKIIAEFGVLGVVFSFVYIGHL